MKLFSKFQKTIKPSGNVPEHIAIIMDGNGRWAKKRGLMRTAGHAAGSETFRKIAIYCNKLGVKYLTVYAFSTENWARPQEEVNTIMMLLEKYFKEAIEKMKKERIRLKVLGDISVLSPHLRGLIDEIDKISESINPTLEVNVCINYGGRDEILHACQKIAKQVQLGVLNANEITKDILEKELYTAGMPDPDLIIRPSGEYRLSNFLLWQCAYSEFYFSQTLWPDFNENEIDKAIASFKGRNRRFGGV